MGWCLLVILYNTVKPRLPTYVITIYEDLPSSYVLFNENHVPEVLSTVLIYEHYPSPLECPGNTNHFHGHRVKRRNGEANN